MNIRFTEHSIERFIERRMPWASVSEALSEMQDLAASGCLMKERTKEGDEKLLADGVIFVLKRDGSGSKTECATVLFDRRDSTNPLADEMELFGEIPNSPVLPPLRRRRKSRKSSRW